MFNEVLRLFLREGRTEVNKVFQNSVNKFYFSFSKYWGKKANQCFNSRGTS